MACPSFVDFLKFVATDIEMLEFGALKSRELTKLVEGDVEPLEIEKGVFLRENRHIFYPVVGQVQVNDICKFPHWADLGKTILREIYALHVPYLVHCLGQSI